MAFKINGTHVLVRRNIDKVELAMPYKSYDLIRESVEQKDGKQMRKLTLLGECNASGDPIEGNPHLHPDDIKNISADPMDVEVSLFGYQV